MMVYSQVWTHANKEQQTNEIGQKSIEIHFRGRKEEEDR